METNKNSTINATSSSTAVKNKLFDTQLGKQLEVAMEIILTPPSKVFQTPFWNDLVNEVSNNLNDDDVALVLSKFLQDTIAAKNNSSSAVNKIENVSPPSAPINDAVDDKFITIFKPFKFVSFIQQTAIPDNTT